MFGGRRCVQRGPVFQQVFPWSVLTPKWSDKPLQKSWEKSKPTLGFPRTTDSLCPVCVMEARERIINGEQDWQSLVNEHVGEIKAQIVERDGEVWMVKECPQHGKFEDMMAKDVSFLRWIEDNFPGGISGLTTTSGCTSTAPVPSSMAGDRF